MVRFSLRESLPKLAAAMPTNRPTVRPTYGPPRGWNWAAEFAGFVNSTSTPLLAPLASAANRHAQRDFVVADGQIERDFFRGIAVVRIGIEPGG